MEKIDAYTISKAHPIPTGSPNTTLYWAQKDFETKTTICQIVELDPKKTRNVQEAINKFEFLKRSNFPGFLLIDHYRITDKFVAVFFQVTGNLETLTSVLGSGYSLSNYEAVRLGMMLLDCYQLFYQANIVVQEIE